MKIICSVWEYAQKVGKSVSWVYYKIRIGDIKPIAQQDIIKYATDGYRVGVINGNEKYLILYDGSQ